MQIFADYGAGSAVDQPIDLFQWNEVGVISAFIAPGPGYALPANDDDLIRLNRDLLRPLSSREA
jgi:hypothetical protein